MLMLDFANSGSFMLLHSFCCSDFSFSVYGLSRIDLFLFVLETLCRWGRQHFFVHLLNLTSFHQSTVSAAWALSHLRLTFCIQTFLLFSQGFVHSELTTFVYGLVRSELLLLALDFSHFGSPSSIRAPTRLGPALLVYGLCWLGFLLPSLDYVNIWAS